MNLLVKPLSRWIYDNDLNKKEIFLGLKIWGMILCMNIPYPYPSFSGENLGKKQFLLEEFSGELKEYWNFECVDWNWFHWLPATVSSSPRLQISWSNSLGDISPWTKPETKVLYINIDSNSELLNCHVATSDLVWQCDRSSYVFVMIGRYFNKGKNHKIWMYPQRCCWKVTRLVLKPCLTKTYSLENWHGLDLKNDAFGRGISSEENWEVFSWLMIDTPSLNWWLNFLTYTTNYWSFTKIKSVRSSPLEKQKQPVKDLREHMDVSENSGTPKSSILIGFSIIFTIHFGVPLFLETPICTLAERPGRGIVEKNSSFFSLSSLENTSKQYVPW